MLVFFRDTETVFTPMCSFLCSCDFRLRCLRIRLLAYLAYNVATTVTQNVIKFVIRIIFIRILSKGVVPRHYTKYLFGSVVINLFAQIVDYANDRIKEKRLFYYIIIANIL